VLTLVPPPDQIEARELLRLVMSWQPILWALEILLLPLAGLALLAGGFAWGALLIGAAVALILTRYGPSWWPGRR
jgi:hypothetical protein